jgi:hypothetical protein
VLARGAQACAEIAGSTHSTLGKRDFGLSLGCGFPVPYFLQLLLPSDSFLVHTAPFVEQVEAVSAMCPRGRTRHRERIVLAKTPFWTATRIWYPISTDFYKEAQ